MHYFVIKILMCYVTIAMTLYTLTYLPLGLFHSLQMTQPVTLTLMSCLVLSAPLSKFDFLNIVLTVFGLALVIVGA